MAKAAHSEAGFTPWGAVLLGCAALVVLAAGFSAVSQRASAPDPRGQLAQVNDTPPPPPAEQQSTPAKASAACATGGLPASIPPDHFLRRQLIQNVGGAQGICGVNSNGSVVIAGSSVDATCRAYPGPAGTGATAQCPTAVVSRDADGGGDSVICWDVDPGKGCPTGAAQEGTNDEEHGTPEQTAQERTDALAEELQDASSQPQGLTLSTDRRSACNSVGQCIAFEDVGYTEQLTDMGREGWVTPDGEFIPESDMAAHMQASPLVQQAALQQSSTVPGDVSDVVYAGDTSFDPTNPSAPPPTANNQPVQPPPSAPAPSATPSAPPTQSVGNPNPVTPGHTGGGAQTTGAGLGNTPGAGSGSTAFGSGEPRYQSLQPVSGSGAPRQGIGNEPSIVERFARLIGADTRPMLRTTPHGTGYAHPQAVTPAQERFIIRANDAHYRSIQEIASDVATGNIPADSRVDHYARTLRVVGGPNTNSRATTTNTAFASLQDLIVEDEAIRAMFVAEQTALREKNRVFCVDGEESAECKARREAVSERVERETFIEELTKRDLPDNAVQHFLAVYDGWVSPDLPVPGAAPLMLSDAAAQEPQEANDTPDQGFVSWAWDGVRNSAARMIDALRSWLTP